MFLMNTRRYLRWLWLAVILDIAHIGRELWYEGREVFVRLPYWSLMEWFADPEPLVRVVFHALGVIGILMAVKGDVRPLLFWSVCHFAVLITPINSMDLWSIRLIAESVIATIAVYIVSVR